MAARGTLVVLLALCVSSAFAKTYFLEKFHEGWESNWKKSSWKQSEGTAGDWEWTAGEWYGDAEEDKGIKTTPDARFFALSSKLEESFTNTDVPLVLQYNVRFTAKPDCGGAYIKLVPASSANYMDKFSGDTPYSIMFGPDICGYTTRKVHVILTKDDKNHLIKKDIDAKMDRKTHVYTLAIFPNQTYEVYIDLEKVQSGSLEEDWDILAPKMIKDPDAKKPDDWEDDPTILDPEDKKPEGYDDIPKKIADPEAKQPDDWNEEEDGEWEPPMIPNPEYKGPWKARMIDNPKYKGQWSAPLIDNPDYKPRADLHVFPDIKYVGFELWQVKAGSIFDNIIVTDSLDEAFELAQNTWAKSKDKEKEMLDEYAKEDSLREAKEEAERKKKEDEMSKEFDELEDDTPRADQYGDELDHTKGYDEAEDEEVEREQAAEHDEL